MTPFRLGQAPFILGLWLKGLQTFHDDFHGPKKKSFQWISLTFLQIVQEQVYKMWSLRNEILHDAKKTGATINALELEARINKVLQRRPPVQFLHKADIAYFKRIQQGKKRPWDMTRKLQWVEGAEQLLLATYEVEESQQTERLQSFFQWDPG